MWLKLAGSIVVIVVCSYMGFAKAARYVQRSRQLGDIIGLLHMFETQLSYLSNTLSECFQKNGDAVESPVSAIFHLASQYTRPGSGMDACTAWIRAVREGAAAGCALDAADIEVLASMGKLLGSSDTDGQISNIRYTISQLEIQQEKALDAQKRNERLYKNIGVLAGVAIVVVLL